MNKVFWSNRNNLVLGRLFIFIVIALSLAAGTPAQTTEFAYQGQLQSSSAPAAGNFDFEFLLYDAASGGSQVGMTLTKGGVAVANGIFSVPLDFGSNYPGANRYLEIHVRQTGSGAFTPLTPRQAIASTPYAIKSLNADTAANAVNAANLTGNLTGDVNGTQNATVVTAVGGQSAANVGGAVQSVNAATSNNTANALVKRDASGNFIAGTITGNITGNAATATNATNATNAVNATTATNATQLNGQAAAFYQSASNLSNGTLADARLSANVATLAGSQTFTGTKTFTAATTFNNNVGIGTGSPQRALSIVGGLVVDQGGQNTTSNGFGITFGSFSGEGIASNRNPGFNQFGLDFYAGGGSTPRMSITNGGKVGIGTNTPSATLDVEGNAGIGVVGTSSAANSTGVLGAAVSIGVIGNSNSGIGVSADSDSGIGLRVLSNGSNMVEGYNSLAGARKFHIDHNGTYTAGSDFAEALPAIGKKTDYGPGDVLVVSTKTPGKIEKTSRPYDTRVAGVYSTRPGVLGAEKSGASRVDADDVPVAIVGIVPTKVTSINGPIKVGDLLTTSSVPGYAMRCADRVKCVGAVVGKALEPLTGNKGVIRVLVMLR